MTGGSSLGDLVRTISALRIDDDDTAARVARMLGILSTAPARRQGRPITPAGDRQPSATAEVAVGLPSLQAAVQGDVVTPVSPSDVPQPEPRAEPGAGEPDRPVERTAAAETAEVVAAVLPHRPVPASVTMIREPSAPRGNLPRSDSEPIDLSSVTAEYVTPWPAPWAAGIAFAAAASMVDLHRIDVRAVVTDIALGRRPNRLPTRHRLSGRRGLQLLLDHGDAMRPFLADREWIKGLVIQAIGNHRVESVHFREILTGRVATGPPLREHAAYRPPPPGVPILLFSDLGALRVGRPARGRLDMLVSLASAHQITLITPCHADEYPAALRDAALIVPLDPRLRLRQVVDSRTRPKPRRP